MTDPLFRSAPEVARIVAITLCACILFTAASVHAADASLDRPYWSVEIKGGNFYPAIDNWKEHYGDDHTWQVAGSIGYKVLRWAEIGIEGGKIEDRGLGYAPVNGFLTGHVIYELYPVNAFVLVRGVFDEGQWLVPYIGGGYTRMYYREKIEGQGTVRGAANGYHSRAGIQLLLDTMDRKSADNLRMTYGIMHTYLIFEAQLTKATVDSASMGSVDLGGTSYLGGLLFEF